jgi:hypothetical protein
MTELWILDENDNPIPEPNLSKQRRWMESNPKKVIFEWFQDGKRTVACHFEGAGRKDQLFRVVITEDNLLIGYRFFESRDAARDFFNKLLMVNHAADVMKSMEQN